MNTNDNMLLNDSILNSQIKNKGFAILDSTFKQHQWHLIKNELNWIPKYKFIEGIKSIIKNKKT